MQTTTSTFQKYPDTSRASPWQCFPVSSPTDPAHHQPRETMQQALRGEEDVPRDFRSGRRTSSAKHRVLVLLHSLEFQSEPKLPHIVHTPPFCSLHPGRPRAQQRSLRRGSLAGLSGYRTALSAFSHTRRDLRCYVQAHPKAPTEFEEVCI